ncbi:MULTISPECIES: hypothetical protein [unclassified Stenotrophomonas]|uniref:hypothetical protein n=1 Tax=unclassified Stenotrophomonas TaxID=196198 RepID=UPI0024473ECB|nr:MULTISPECIES: hypothetical protein [unclassified Stenotrophomonas]MDH0273187.1 hypothetical protein [Stenotrophomonas sp. GD04089]MDH1910702.1 hypothetical protein [Stenotrophomonas sp. GD03794]
MTANLTILPTNCPVLREAFETISAIAVEAVWLPNQAKAITLAQAQTALRDLHHRLPRLQDLRVFEAPVAAYFSTLRSSLQDGDTPLCDTTRARLAQATELLELVRNQTRTVVDPADPWRGLYHPSRLPARNADGEIPCHPDVPMWADGREVSLRPLFLAQGFDLQVTFGDFTDEAVETGDHRYWDEMRAWQPIGPGADWRLVWLGDTEDGPAAWFVRPLAIAAMNWPIAAPTLANAQPGGRVRLGDRPKDGEVRVEVSGLTGSGKSAIAGEIEILCKALGLEVEWVNGDEEKRVTHADWIGALEMYKPRVVIVEQNIPRAALSAQPSPGGQGDARSLAEHITDHLCHHEYDIGGRPELLACVVDALAARQPVGEPDHLRGTTEMIAPPAQAVDLPYSLDADPAGIRARVCDVITGTLMVGAQGHTPPPAGHWAEPLWQAALADAALQVKMREALWAAARSLRTIADSTKETEFLETASEIRAYANSRANCAEQALTDSQAVGK